MRIVLAFVLTLMLSACENAQFKNREKGALGGAAIGAGLGAIVGNQSGNPGAGVAIGSAFGALSGALIGNELDNTQGRLDEGNRRLEERDRELEENRRLIDELKSRGADVRSTSRGVVVNLPDVLFQFDSARLTGAARDTAADIADVVRRSDRRVSIEGHTDSIGTVGYNQRLSEDRANEVANELAANGVARRRISARGYGENEPIASNKTEAGRRRNRRVEVIIENR